MAVFRGRVGDSGEFYHFSVDAEAFDQSFGKSLVAVGCEQVELAALAFGEGLHELPFGRQLAPGLAFEHDVEIGFFT